MSDYRTDTPDNDGDEAQEPGPKLVPRDMPDQQAGADEDHWEVDDDPAGPAPDERPDPEVPDTDEAGTGGRGAAHADGGPAEQPVPEEPTA
ncbi:hypothetical protein RB628_33100 [Streptomyces sp. ADMS]|uniref:hypothetical protein n=1 Tax=Streptomyces sp. ADMS TaxID=3071415 RepID=UPI00296F0731|nr:hypothetical protein [Streptomyces sp. ADMS]MDW4910039.1 hypothetical protein [Streptomyces sp. ADMS]